MASKRKGFARDYLQGLGASTRHNTVAYGYSVAITVVFGALDVVAGKPSLADLFTFVVGAAAAFALVNGLITRGFEKEEPDEPSLVATLGTSLSIFSVSGSLGAGIGVAYLLGGWLAWLLAAFAGSIAYLLLVGLEMSVAARRQEG